MRALLLLLAGCGTLDPSPAERGHEGDVDAPRGPSARAQARDGVDRASTGPDATWWATVAPRIAAEARAFRPDGATSFAARTPVLTARLGADGLTASARDGAELTLSFSAWGRAGAEIPVGVAAPALGDCVPGEQDARGACVRRVERAYGEVTEWWVSRAQGVQQGWDVAAPPAGDGPLTLVLAVDGADAEMAGDELVLVDTRGNTWTYGGLAAWDADGEPLPAWMTVGGDGRIVVSVDDTDARYPVVVDPLLTTAATTLTGPGTVVSTQLGETLATADVNGDGFADVVVGADNYLAGDGAVFVFHGAASGLGATAATRLDPPSTSPGAFGWNIADAGDVNGDGYDDVLVSGTSGGATEVVSVFHGSAAGLGASPSASLSASSSGTYFGRALAGGADVNHDGYDDIVIGAPRTSSRAGAVYVHHGSASGVATSPARTLTPPSGQFYFGARVTLGDFDRDGHADLAVNAPYHGMLYVYEGSAAGVGAGITTAMSAELGLMSSTAAQPAVGDWNGDGTDDLVWVDGLEVRVHHGSAAGLSSSATATLSVSYAFGSDEVLAAAGDADGDGYDDLLVFDGEEIDWHRGGAAGLSDDASATLADPGTAPTGESDTRFGYARAAGDVDGDGFSDVVIGASQADAAYVFAGARAGLSTTSSLTLGGEGLSTFGEVVTGAGDVNGDGFADVAVGDPEAEAVYVFHGSAAGVGTTAATTLGDGAASGTFGAAVAGAGDVNGDGFDDLLVGAEGESVAGAAYVFHGSAGGLGTTAATTLSSGSTSDRYGRAVAGLGDVNRDGFADIAVSAPYLSGYTGRVHVHHGADAGVSSTAARTLTGASTASYFGDDLDGAGDVNGDGHDDLVVGAWGASSSRGAAYVFHGGASGIEATASRTISGTASGGWLGRRVEGAGDVDADGYDDVVVTSPGYLSSTGLIQLFRGSGTGIAATATQSITGAAAWSDWGLYVAGLGDVNGDGHADLAATLAGGVYDTYVYLGGSSGYDTTAATTFAGSGEEDFGEALAGVGDVNGDGADDFVVGVADLVPHGAAYVFHGDPPAIVDADRDGAPAGEDCDDADPAVTSEAVWHPDADGDGFGDAATASVACAAPPGHVADGSDCDDERAAARPGGVEVCDADNVDEDCDGRADDLDTASGTITFHLDADLDGFGDEGATVTACDTGAGRVADATDCDDGHADIHPGAVEVCDDADVDEDCDGLADDADTAAGATTFHADADGDGFGDPGVTLAACDAAAGRVTDASDCDDARADVSPAASEVCDDADTDEDCDGRVDDADAVLTSSLSVFYTDADGDGLGDTAAPVSACDARGGLAETGGDCDDGDAAVHPGAPEDDCADPTDYDCDGSGGADDRDGDGVLACEDCDDRDAARAGPIPWYVDADGDGYGVGDGLAACDGPTGTASADGDCDDADPAWNPGAAEPDCDDPNDYNCDGSVGLDDLDADGAPACTDCDDADPLRHPDADEVCDGADRDEDCDALADDADSAVDLSTVSVWYADTDGDGFGDAGAPLSACDAPAGHVADATDCDDTDAGAFPGGAETAGDGVDQDCDGADLAVTEPPGEEGGCGCGATTGPSGALVLLGVAALAARRRRQARAPTARPWPP